MRGGNSSISFEKLKLLIVVVAHLIDAVAFLHRSGIVFNLTSIYPGFNLASKIGFKRCSCHWHLGDDFRKTLKEVNYDSKDGKRVSKEIGEKWWSMTDAEKKPYLDRVIELKAEYEKAMEIYNATKKEDQQEGYDKSNKEATAVPTRQEIVTLQGSELLPYFFRILIYMFSLPIL
ncbi:hypothetical protein P8452_56533 [Trifolium repens]|nr:hypothetical protein P8452_56533 [Trifolium repens]